MEQGLGPYQNSQEYDRDDYTKVILVIFLLCNGFFIFEEECKLLHWLTWVDSIVLLF